MLPSVITGPGRPTVSQARPRAKPSRHGAPRPGATATSSPPAALPAEEDDGERDEEDEAPGDPHDEPAQVLVGARGELLPDPRRRRVVRVEHAVGHADEDRHHHHRQAHHEEVEHLHG